jgi:hydroxymethylglutaryl-CoA lyase
VVTEDLVFMFESMGVSTGIDMVKLVPVYGMTADAGLPLGFAQTGAHA